MRRHPFIKWGDLCDFHSSFRSPHAYSQHQSIGIVELSTHLSGCSGADPDSFNQSNTRPASLESDEKIELEVLFEELAEIIESEAGLLIP